MKRLLILSLSIAFISTGAQAEGSFQYEAGINAIHQSTNVDIPASNTLTADFAFRYLEPNYEINFGLVTASKIATDSVANAIQYASPHPGIDGNVHVSELFTNIKLSESSNVFMGIMNGSGWLDTSLISNDDTQNFITPDFINNLTLDFPDYTPGIGLITQINPTVMSTFYLSTARELDISQANIHEYRDQEGTEEDTDDRGFFAATETAWVIDNGFISLGAWYRSGDYVHLSNDQDNQLKNFGVYSVLSKTYGNTSLESRLGWANPKVSEVAQFYALNLEQKTPSLLAKSRIGAGISRRIAGDVPSNSPLKDSCSALEVYFAVPINNHFEVTPFIQSFQPAVQVEGTPFSQSNLWAIGIRMRLFTINEI